MGTETDENTILLVEDDPAVAREIVEHFGELGLSVRHVDDGAKGFELAKTGDYALVILDVVLPGKNGFDVCRELRIERPLLPDILLTTRTSEIDRVLGFELGADDYVVKPFSLRELVARVRSKLRRLNAESVLGDRRSSSPTATSITIGEISIDSERRTVSKNSEPIPLTAKEFDLLLYLMQHPGKVFTKYDLLESVWEVEVSGYEEAVVSMIRRLRTKIEEDPARPIYVLTTRGVGYYFTEPERLSGGSRSSS